jgi:hypothetical protein
MEYRKLGDQASDFELGYPYSFMDGVMGGW